MFLISIFYCLIFFLSFSCLDFVLIRIRSHFKIKRLGRKIMKTKKEREVRRDKEGDIKAKKGLAYLIKILIIKILII